MNALAAQTRTELRLNLRNGEQLLVHRCRGCDGAGSGSPVRR